MRYSIIVCTRNRPAFLVDCLRSILQNHHDSWEVIVVDQSDTPASEEVVSEYVRVASVPVRYIKDGGRGLSRAQNVAISTAKGEFLVFTHDDIVVAPNWIASYEEELRLLRFSPRAVLSGRVEPGEPEGRGVLAPSIKTDLTRREYCGKRKEGVLYPNNMLVAKNVFNVAGYFDGRLGPGTSLPAAEDNDFCYRLLLKGYSILYVPDVVVWHRSWRTPEEMRVLGYDYARGQGGFYAKHMWRCDRFILKLFLGDVFRAAGGLTKAVVLNRTARRAERWNELRGLVEGACRMTGKILWEPFQNLKHRAGGLLDTIRRHPTLHQLQRYALVVSVIRRDPHATVLDVGSGPNGLAALCPSRQIIGCDLTYDRPPRGNVLAVGGAAETLPFSDRSVDYLSLIHI